MCLDQFSLLLHHIMIQSLGRVKCAQMSRNLEGRIGKRELKTGVNLEYVICSKHFTNISLNLIQLGAMFEKNRKL